jgi:8-oxo-dGTP pyrophosphatase MutT (NUDIX family)
MPASLGNENAIVADVKHSPQPQSQPQPQQSQHHNSNHKDTPKSEHKHKSKPKSAAQLLQAKQRAMKAARKLVTPYPYMSGQLLPVDVRGYAAAGVIPFRWDPSEPDAERCRLQILLGREDRRGEAGKALAILAGKRDLEDDGKPYVTAAREFREESGYVLSPEDEKLLSDCIAVGTVMEKEQPLPLSSDVIQDSKHVAMPSTIDDCNPFDSSKHRILWLGQSKMVFYMLFATHTSILTLPEQLESIPIEARHEMGEMETLHWVPVANLVEALASTRTPGSTPSQDAICPTVCDHKGDKVRITKLLRRFIDSLFRQLLSSLATATLANPHAWHASFAIKREEITASLAARSAGRTSSSRGKKFTPSSAHTKTFRGGRSSGRGRGRGRGGKSNHRRTGSTRSPTSWRAQPDTLDSHATPATAPVNRSVAASTSNLSSPLKPRNLAPSFG